MLCNLIIQSLKAPRVGHGVGLRVGSIVGPGVLELVLVSSGSEGFPMSMPSITSSDSLAVAKSKKHGDSVSLSFPLFLQLAVPSLLQLFLFL